MGVAAPSCTLCLRDCIQTCRIVLAVGLILDGKRGGCVETTFYFFFRAWEGLTGVARRYFAPAYRSADTGVEGNLGEEFTRKWRERARAIALAWYIYFIYIYTPSVLLKSKCLVSKFYMLTIEEYENEWTAPLTRNLNRKTVIYTFSPIWIAARAEQKRMTAAPRSTRASCLSNQ